MTTAKRDINQEAARIEAGSSRRITDEPLPADLEAAWQQWSKAVKRVDERTMGLLKAAFEAGAEAGLSGRGRAGGRKGGKARAAALTTKQRSEIAKKAAKARWTDKS